ncbi:MAG: cyclic nucleotide-binding domain-containing protein [Thermoanaerobaculaceae bacterium]|nr:cyclic nucleotide-binding domain-containing protein [Thermoanaerobaculaceae bacterium]MDI9621120.1 cyclic nucleotide-binding domain-containing protein [Acidobacteriota bacterium]NLH12096.1 cyclic nucleotide-binding domain-containing protein [Holophagae bacterium]HPW55555.1 cyclic nucleotide-binding domain-containing protein [Thermoanaerobaculaceae bacterium]
MSDSQITPHPIWAQRLAAIAERLEKSGVTGVAAELLDVAASITSRGEEFRRRADELRRRGDQGSDPEREHKRHNLEASHAVGMARLFEARGELQRALEMLDLAKLRAPFHYLAYASAGYLHLRRRDLRAAVEEFVQARRLNPLDRKLAIEAARIALELEDFQEALKHALDAQLLSHGVGDSEDLAARRRVQTLTALCRISPRDLAELGDQRASGLQRASDQVALTRARLFSGLPPSDQKVRKESPKAQRDELLRVTLDLRRFRAFRHFSDSQLFQLGQVGRSETYRHAQVIMREDYEERDVFVILSGRVQVCRRSPIGTQTLATLGVGDVFGDVSYLDGRPRSSTILGLDQGTVLRFPAHDLERLTATNRELGVALLWTFWHSLAAKTRAANLSMTQIISPGTAPQRVAAGQPGERVHIDEAAKIEVLQEQGLSASELRLLASYSSEERFAPEALIFGEGERGDKLYIVVEGGVRISRRLPGMGEEALAILKRGEVFGEMALIDDLPRSADARSHLQGCTVFTVDRQRLEEILDMDPDAAHQFLTLLCQLLCRRLRAMNDRLVAWRLMVGHE